ncbi:MAG: nucleoside-diphosphate kinase [Gloeobacterales cyanobacterium]
MMERTFIAVKPDGVQRGLVGTILKKFEEKGYKLVGLKLMQVSQELAQTHYGEHKGKPFFDGLVNFITSGPVVAFVLEGNDVVVTARKMIGATKPSDSAIGTIRGDYGVDIGRNIIHGSDSPESAEREIALWFKPEELTEWTPTLSTWVYE